MDDLNAVYAEQLGIGQRGRLRFAPVRTGVLSWNTHAEEGRIAFRLLRAGTPDGDWVDHSRWEPGGSTSLNATHDGTSVNVDVITAQLPFDGIEVWAPGVRFELIAFSAPVAPRSDAPLSKNAFILDVPQISQYADDRDERGWCSPTSLAMIHAYHGIVVPVEEAAREVFDRAYNGTGNWSFNVAYSGRLGFRATVAHFAGMEHARRLVERNLPLAISYSWTEGELDGAPLPHSDGHLAVLCGFTGNGDCVLNDPAHPAIRVVYPRAQLERLWLRNYGVAYVIAPVGIEYAGVLQHPDG
jgi:hypothetical protein